MPQRYVFSSSIWMMKTQRNKFMFEHMMAITKGMSAKIDDSMKSIFVHLQTHHEWSRVLAIQNQTVISRQVGLHTMHPFRQACPAGGYYFVHTAS